VCEEVLVCTPDELMRITLLRHIAPEPGWPSRDNTLPNRAIPRVVRPTTCLFYSFCCPFVARYGAALLSRWPVIQSSLVTPQTDLERAVFRRDGVGDAAPIIPRCRFPRASAGERVRSDGSTPPFQDTHPGLDHARARNAKVLSMAKTWGLVLLHQILRGCESDSKHLCYNSAF
jgi:hypothetical protein